ncbi:FAD-binding oxidoreductase [Stieleria magnilauensis]|uniref:4-cresol dehydrogenase [hydroxylating] flavoprotein subunit n=1 Tax=Stieleria magnilauensis TaxID=2527963 RepID=A0ABX5XM03_9BACT|nr:4-cresol dehydrogenase [hydroxylating] flavoprotein subunit [Planctomycetes bacterium TBK1r]
MPIAVVRPQAGDQVAKIVEIAARFKTPLYPISTGRNWGYGAATPVQRGCTVVDLSDLRAIRFVDEQLGLIELEPGVTQGMLHEFLDTRGLDWMVPVHGGGPDCSLLGNALERGYGLTPTTDHFAALTSLEAVLADGSTYQSPFRKLGLDLIAAAHRWQIGPYVEGLFSQGNFGIVTRATFELQRRPEHVEAFFLRLRDDSQLCAIVESLRTVLADLGGSIAGVNLMNDRRVLSMSRPYPVDQVEPGDIISESLCHQMTASAGISRWTVAGVIHCPTDMRRTVRKLLWRRLPDSVSRPIHMNRRRVRVARAITKRLPIGSRSVLQQIDSIESLLDLADGIPRRVALPLAYWLRGEQPESSAELNPARDGCGLLWYSPLVPMKQEFVEPYVQMVESTCASFGIEPLFTLTTLSDRLFDSTVPILYRPEEPGAIERAHACYAALVAEGIKLGCVPYRMSTRTFAEGETPGTMSEATNLTKQLKDATDPNGLIAPGRYFL